MPLDDSKRLKVVLAISQIIAKKHSSRSYLQTENLNFDDMEMFTENEESFTVKVRPKRTEIGCVPVNLDREQSELTFEHLLVSFSKEGDEPGLKSFWLRSYLVIYSEPHNPT